MNHLRRLSCIISTLRPLCLSEETIFKAGPSSSSSNRNTMSSTCRIRSGRRSFSFSNCHKLHDVFNERTKQLKNRLIKVKEDFRKDSSPSVKRTMVIQKIHQSINHLNWN